MIDRKQALKEHQEHLKRDKTIWKMHRKGSGIDEIAKAANIPTREVLSILWHLHSIQPTPPIWTLLSYRPFRVLFEQGFTNDYKILVGLLEKRIYRSFAPDFGKKSFIETQDIFYFYFDEIRFSIKNKSVRKSLEGIIKKSFGKV